MRTLAIVPARAGSKGVQGKNRRDFMGRPLAAWAMMVGQDTCHEVVVTSDDPRILEVADGYGVQALERPAELAQDETPMVDVVRHALACQAEPYDAVVLLQPTQPLRTADHVRRALARFGDDCDSVVSVVEIPAHYSPEWALRLRGKYLSRFVGGEQPTRRQDCEPAYYRDGTVYVIRAILPGQGELYGRSVPLVVPASESCTIDDEADWTRAEEMWRRQHGSV